MHIRISIPDIVSITAICTCSWLAEGHQVGWAMWVALGAFGLGRLTQFILGNS